MPAFRPGSFLDRVFSGGRATSPVPESRALEQIPAPFMAAFGGLAGMPHPFKPYESLNYYGDNLWLYACISIVSQEASRVKLKLMKRKKNAEDEGVPEHQALSTLRRPMSIKEGRSILTSTQFKQLLFKYILLNGEGYMLLDGRMKGKFGGAPTRLHPLMPAFVLEKLNAQYEIECYLYQAAGSQIELDPLDVVHFKDPDPKNWYRGHSPVQSARFALDSHKEADEFNYYRLLNRGVPDLFLSPENKMSPEEQKRFKEQWQQQYAGSRNGGKTVVFPTKMGVTGVQTTTADMQYEQLKNLSKDEILANFRIPIEMLGKTDSQTRANAEASNYVFQRFTILPLIESFVDTLTNDYLPAFPKSDDLYFGFEEFVPQDLEDKRKTTQTLFGIGALTPNEGRVGFGLDKLEIPQADIPFVPFNVTPLAAQNPNPVIDDDVEADLEGDDTDETDDDGERSAKKKSLKRSDDPASDDPSDELPADVSEFFDKEKETSILALLTVPFLLEAFRRGIDLANQGATDPVPEEDIFNANVRKAIEEKSLAMSAKAVQTTEDQLREVLLQAHDDGVGVRGLASEINDLYGESMGYRSLRIARTEITGSINDGAMQTYADKGYTAKMWSTTMDGHERDSHGQANGQTVPMDEPFHLAGGDGMFPGDPSLPIEEIANCRCVIQPADSANSDDSQAAEDRQIKLNQLFLRYHADVEAKFRTAIVGYFQRERGAIVHKLTPPNL